MLQDEKKGDLEQPLIGSSLPVDQPSSPLAELRPHQDEEVDTEEDKSHEQDQVLQHQGLSKIVASGSQSHQDSHKGNADHSPPLVWMWKLIAGLIGTVGTYADSCMKVSISLQALDVISNSNTNGNIKFVYPLAILPWLSTFFFHYKENLENLNKINELSFKEFREKSGRLIRNESPIILVGLIAATAKWSIIYNSISDQSSNPLFPAFPLILASFGSLQFIILDVEKLVLHSKQGFDYENDEYNKWLNAPNIYLVSKIPDQKALKATYKNTYIFSEEKSAKLVYIDNHGNAESLTIEKEEFDQIKISSVVDKSKPLKNQVNEDILDKFWSIITKNKGHTQSFCYGPFLKKGLINAIPVTGALWATALAFNESRELLQNTIPNLSSLTVLILGTGLSFIYGVDHLTSHGYETKKRFIYLASTGRFFLNKGESTTFKSPIQLFILCAFVGGLVEIVSKAYATAEFCGESIYSNRGFILSFAICSAVTSFLQYCAVEAPPIICDEKEGDWLENRPKRDFLLRYGIVEFVGDSFRMLVHMMTHFIPVSGLMDSGICSGFFDCLTWGIVSECLIKRMKIKDFRERKVVNENNGHEENLSINSSTRASFIQNNNRKNLEEAATFLEEQTESIKRGLFMCLIIAGISITGKFFELNVAKKENDGGHFITIFLTGMLSILLTRIIDHLHKKRDLKLSKPSPSYNKPSDSDNKSSHGSGSSSSSFSYVENVAQQPDPQPVPQRQSRRKRMSGQPNLLMPGLGGSVSSSSNSSSSSVSSSSSMSNS